MKVFKILHQWAEEDSNKYTIDYDRDFIQVPVTKDSYRSLTSSVRINVPNSEIRGLVNELEYYLSQCKDHSLRIEEAKVLTPSTVKFTVINTSKPIITKETYTIAKN